MAPILLWLRRDFRLTDHAAFYAAAKEGRPIIPIFIRDEIVDSLGAAPKWRLGEAIDHFDQTLRSIGSQLVLRSGDPQTVLAQVIDETGADSIYWSRAYDPASVKRDKAVKAALTQQNILAKSFSGHLLYEPWLPQTKQGGAFKVYTPFWNHVSKILEVDATLPKVSKLMVPAEWPKSEKLSDWRLGSAMNRGKDVVKNYSLLGEDAALDRLDLFLKSRVTRYKSERDFPSRDGTSGLSEPLAYGEISPRQILNALRSFCDISDENCEHFFKEIVWREFAYHLYWHFPKLDQANWNATWDRFPWQNDPEIFQRWALGQTGEELVDAGLRELYTTGRMHNRIRMIAGSYLTKHLLQSWQNGLAWFADCLVDWDPASNAMGWQWVSGCGPDAAPYFRVFNPARQAQNFDLDSSYRNYWLTGEGAAAFMTAVPISQLKDLETRPKLPLVSLQAGRVRALEAYDHFKNAT